MKTKNQIKFACWMSLITTFFVSFVLIAINLGFRPEFALIWLRSWGIAFLLVALSILYIGPIISKKINQHEKTF